MKRQHQTWGCIVLAMVLLPVISDGQSPNDNTRFLSTYGFSATSVEVSGNTLFVAHDSYITRFDVSVPSSPAVQCNTNTGPGFSNKIWDMQYKCDYTNGKHILFAGAAQDYFLVYDVTSPNSIVCMDTVFTSSSVDNYTTSFPTMQIQYDTLLIIAYNTAPLLIYNISDPLNIQLLSTFFPVKNEVFPTAGRHIVALYKTNLIVFDNTNRTLRCVDIADPRNPTFIDNIENRDNSTGYYVKDTLLYLLSNYSQVTTELEIIDISDIHDFRTLSKVESVFSLPGGTLTGAFITVVDHYAYICQSDSMIIYDVTDPEHPQYAGFWGGAKELSTPYYFDIAVVDNIIFIASYSATNGLIVLEFDPTTPTQPVPASSDFLLHPAYPNPFTGSTHISYTLAAQEYVSLEVFDMLGRKVHSLYEGVQQPGAHTAEFSASGIPAGAYRVVLRTANGTQSKTVVVQ